ncbi:LacI family DNA-binding transcriptional regulator [Nocardioides sp. ChNu-99]|uniref:LacI family DNA-binding transcriptional regulator n=1 Tax=Nocardioides sp. ChNu-99 TaxID=2839897 RepID=UPI002404B6BD|nr:LacI family DNA-binding transcriptional regulator [Nocardioides sp. ChNu-99]MDF9714976.1 LacI family transcriptional regulator [Nocardioides sp. ChNu-99]
MPEAQVRDVARLAGVSPGTVSNALNHPEKVSPATRERILSAISELGFVPNDAARQLRRGTNASIGMIVLDIANPFFTAVAHGVEQRLAEVGRPLVLANSGQNHEREVAYLDLFAEQRLSGVLVTPAGQVLDRLRRLRDRGTAIVVVDRKTGAREFSSVSVDDSLGGRLATQHLLEIGRRRIAFIGGPEDLSQIKHRLGAARTAVEEHGSGEIVHLDVPTLDVEAGRTGARDLLDLPAARRPDAIFAANDLIALGVLQTLTLRGVRVPDDIALVGYDDIDFAAAAAIPLTSVRQPAVAMGEAATSRLLDVIADPAGSQVEHIVLEPELVVRRSTVA